MNMDEMTDVDPLNFDRIPFDYALNAYVISDGCCNWLSFLYPLNEVFFFIFMPDCCIYFMYIDGGSSYQQSQFSSVSHLF